LSISAKNDFLSSAMEAIFRLMLRDLSQASLDRQNNILVAFQMQAWRKRSRSGACAFPVAWLSLSRESSPGARLV